MEERSKTLDERRNEYRPSTLPPLSVIVLPLPSPLYGFSYLRSYAAMQITSSGERVSITLADSFEIFERRVRSPEAKRLIKSIIGWHRAARLIRRVLNRSTFRGFVFRSDRAGIDRVCSHDRWGGGEKTGSPSEIEQKVVRGKMRLNRGVIVPDLWTGDARSYVIFT